jgi:uncharacterized protein YbjT (DUF2867 family)
MKGPTLFDHRTVLVTGATGGQGGAVARRLLDHGWTVRALVRDTGTRRAKELAARGAHLMPGDLDDPPSLRLAADGVHGVFSVQPADLADPRPADEVRRGRHVADAAADAGVAHLVYSSVAAAGRHSGVAHFESKTQVEAHVRSAGVPATVLRPVFFMENWMSLLPTPPAGERVGAVALDPDTPLQLIALADIGRIAVDAFERPDACIGRTVEIAGDELTVRQIAGTFTRVDGIPTRVRRQPLDELRAAGDFAAMFDWLNRHGYRVDIAALRERYPALLTFEAWLRGASRGVGG